MQSAGVIQPGLSHAVACPLAIFPDEQTLHSVLPRASVYSPWLQSRQEPSAANLPRSQTLRADFFSRPCELLRGRAGWGCVSPA